MSTYYARETSGARMQCLRQQMRSILAHFLPLGADEKSADMKRAYMTLMSDTFIRV